MPDDEPLLSRSEEDQVRRSAFTGLLKAFAAASRTCREQWLEYIRNCEAVESSKRKRPRDEPALPPPPAAVIFADEVTTIEEFRALEAPIPSTALGDVAGVPPPSSLSDSALAESILAFVRLSMDRCCGLTLNILPAAQLGFICFGLKLSERPPRNKDALYSILANYHYQHCEKIGKRAVNHTTVILHAQQDHAAQMALAAKKKAVKSVKPEGATTAILSSSTEKAPMRRSTSKSCKTLGGDDDTSAEESEQLDVTASKPLLSRRKNGSGVSPAPKGSPLSTSGFSLSAPLRAKLITLVQVFDPVTFETLMKKLSTCGYTEPRTEVHAALLALASENIITFENGIAFFTG